MRQLVAAGGLALAACVCGLLFSGAASAREASDSISVTAVVNGTTMTFTLSSTPVSNISLFGGSNWSFTAASSPGGNCNLTPTNGGVFCSYGTPVTSFSITTTITGTPPTAVDGQVGYADAGTGTFEAPVNAAPPCHCTKLSEEFTGFEEERHGYKLVFFLKWNMHCAVGTTGECLAAISITHGDLPRGLRLREHAGKRWDNWTTRSEAELACTNNLGECDPTVSGKAEFKLIGLGADRAHETISFRLVGECSLTHHIEHLTFVFDKHGDLDRKDSHLGKLS